MFGRRKMLRLTVHLMLQIWDRKEAKETESLTTFSYLINYNLYITLE